MSFTIALLFLYRYQSRRQIHIAVWSVAWVLVGFRVLADIYLSFSIADRFIIDLMTIGHDMLWYLGIAALLGFTRMKKEGLTIAYFTSFAALSAYLYFGLHSMVLGTAVTVILMHPAALLILAYLFYLSWVKTRHVGVAIISGSFILWALDYIIFGIPYFAFNDIMAGVYGWSIGFIFRVTIFIGFITLIARR